MGEEEGFKGVFMLDCPTRMSRFGGWAATAYLGGCSRMEQGCVFEWKVPLTTNACT